MFFLKMYTTVVVVIILLSLKGFYSTKKRRYADLNELMKNNSFCPTTEESTSQTTKSELSNEEIPLPKTKVIKGFNSPKKRNISSSSSQSSSEKSTCTSRRKYTFIKEDIPLPVVGVFEDRENCEREICAFFNEEPDAYNHVRYAIEELKAEDKLTEHVQFYYYSFIKYIKPGDLIPYYVYCDNVPEENRGDESFRIYFDVKSLETVLYNALYHVTQEMINNSGNSCLIYYFASILSNFEVDIDNVEPTLHPSEFCKMKIEMPPMYEEWDSSCPSD